MKRPPQHEFQRTIDRLTNPHADESSRDHFYRASPERVRVPDLIQEGDDTLGNIVKESFDPFCRRRTHAMIP
jgi:hypothetical protein